MTLQDEVAELFALQGHVVRRIRRVGGFSYDLDIVSNKGEKWIARCEDRPKLRGEHVTVFAKTVTDEHAVQAIIITSGSIDPDAASFAKRANIQALDSTHFRAYLLRARERSTTPIPTPQSPPNPSEVRYPFDEDPKPTGLASSKRCPFCAEEILAAAVVCRYCGRDLTVPQPQVAPVLQPTSAPTKKRVPLAFVLLTLIFLTCMFAAVVSTCQGGTRDVNPNTLAYVYAEQFVRESLKAPTTAKFGGYVNSTVTDLGNNRWRVHSYVDAQNSFGAMIRTSWTAVVRLQADTWYLDSLDTLP